LGTRTSVRTRSDRSVVRILPTADAEMEATLWKSVERLAPRHPASCPSRTGRTVDSRAHPQCCNPHPAGDSPHRRAAPDLCWVEPWEILDIARKYWDQGIRHLVALRGDPPQGHAKVCPLRTDSLMQPTCAGLKSVADFDIRWPAYPECIRRRPRHNSKSTT